MEQSYSTPVELKRSGTCKVLSLQEGKLFCNIVGYRNKGELDIF